MKKALHRQGRTMNALFALLIVLLIAAVFLLNAVALVLSNRYPLHVDLTAGAAYEIGEETKTVLSALTVPVQIDVLAPERNFEGDAYLVQAKYILDRYPQYSPLVSVRYIDYEADPSYAAGHPDLVLKEGDLVVSANDRVKQLSLTSMFNLAYTASGALTVESSRAEEALTAAILSVLSGEEVKIGVVTGHGEQEAENFTALLVNNSYALERVVPAVDELGGYDALLLLAPQTDLSEDDVRALEAYLYQSGDYGKTLFYTASVVQAALPNVETFLSEWGVSVGDGVVFETKADRTYQYQPYYPVADHTSEAYRDKLIDASAPMLLPLSRPLSTLFDARDGQQVETLLSFGGSAGVRPSDAGDDFVPDSAEVWGPFPAMVLASRQVYENGVSAKRSNIVVCGSTNMLDALYLQNSSLSNSQYLLNLFNTLTEREQTITIPPKSLAGKTLGITTGQISTMGMVLGGILPASILLAGVAVWLYRRYK